MKALLIVTALAFLNQGCSIRYLAHLSKGQLSLMHQRQKIQDTLDERDTDPKKIEKLKYSLAVRNFAIETLKLSSPESKSYTKWVQLDRSHVVYNIVVCPKDSLTPKSWSFPFVGRVGYLGFFDLDYAKEYQKEYLDEGYDVYLRGALAYSTLGWFADPIYSTMLAYRHDSLANIIIHELAHETLYFKNKTAFNEGVASFIGNKGALLFLKKQFGVNSIHYKNAVDSQADEIIFSSFIKQAKKMLQDYYARPLTSKEKIKGRHHVFKKIKDQFRLIQPQLKVSYKHFNNMHLDNAVMAGFGQYMESLVLYEKVWKKMNQDLFKTIRYFQSLEDEPNPDKAIEIWLAS